MAYTSSYAVIDFASMSIDIVAGIMVVLAAAAQAISTTIVAIIVLGWLSVLLWKLGLIGKERGSERR